MEITILATGSRGDVQPFVALGVGLQQVGYQVRFVSNAYFEALVGRYGLDFRPLPGDIQAGLQTELGQQYLQSGNLLAGLKYMTRAVPNWYTHIQRHAWQACRDSECLLYSLIDVYGYDIAQKLGIPVIQGHPQSLTPTRAFPMPSLSWPNLNGSLNHLTYLIAEFFAWHLLYRQSINQFRQETLDLPVIGFRGTLTVQRQQHIPALHPFSPTVLPRPTDWPDWVHLTGYWFLPSPLGWQPPAELVDFINQGPPPVYVGFGSMANMAAEEMTRLVLQALKLSGQRGILARGWGSLSGVDVPADIFLLEDVPHDWLFPQLAAVVHHGGAGTTASGLRAGRPSVLVPHFQDQLFWGKRVEAMGVGPKPIPRKNLTAKKLAQRIIVATSDRIMQDQTRQIGQQIRAEDGLGQAIKVIRRYIE